MTDNMIHTIQANAKAIKNILNVKYKVDDIQREYQWERKHIDELITDLESKFNENYDESDSTEKLANYSNYYLGSFITNSKSKDIFIVDGQQRLTSLTLILIYLKNLQNSDTSYHDYLKKSDMKKMNVDHLIFSEEYFHESFNIQIPDRETCMQALYHDEEFDTVNSSESAKNLYDRYGDIKDLFPKDIKNKSLLYFIQWFINKIILVQIETNSDDDAYTIFETTNDRGLHLTPTEMLKGYVISKLETTAQKKTINKLWKQKINKLRDIDKETDQTFFKSWLRAKYAKSIRLNKKDAENEDFEKIGTRFHSWMKDNADMLHIQTPQDCYDFIKNDFDYFSNIYMKIHDATQTFDPNLEHVYYLNQAGFTPSFYFPIIMSPIEYGESKTDITKKIELISTFLEMYLVYKLINHKTMRHSSIRNTMYALIIKIRNKSIDELTTILKKMIESMDVDLSGLDKFILNQQNKKFAKFLLSRMTRYVEQNCDVPSEFKTYVDSKISDPFEIEHIWANKFEAHAEEFTQRDEFNEWRNKLGALLLLPKSFNQAFGDKKYSDKLSEYRDQNILAKSLTPQPYNNDPKFKRFMEKSAIPFKEHLQFKKHDIEEREIVYKKICEKIWNITNCMK